MENENTKIQNEQDNDKKKKRLILIIVGIVVAVILAIVLPITLSKCSGTKYTYSNPTYTWSADYKTCTAERIANEDSNHKETETANSTYEVVTTAKCEEDGKGRYTASFSNEAFETQSKDIVLTGGHTWGSPTYEWSLDNSSCTATVVCSRDSSHTISETVTSLYVDTIPATYTSTGERTYTATFTNTRFVEQTKNVTTDKLDYYGQVPLLSNDGKTVTYGLYPQSNVNDASLISNLDALTTPEANGYYLYNKVYYAKVTATPEGGSSNFDDGSDIVNGTTYWFKCEPITWNVLSNTAGKYFVVSSIILDVHRYDDNSNNYADSEIRSWITGDFYNSAFALNSSFLQTTVVDNSAATTDADPNPYACSNTSDKVFLPSFQDYKNAAYGYNNDESRYCKTTEWSRARGVEHVPASNPYDDFRFNGNYWTRSPYSGANHAFIVYKNGLINTQHFLTTLSNIGVRPALTITIE